MQMLIMLSTPRCIAAWLNWPRPMMGSLVLTGSGVAAIYWKDTDSIAAFARDPEHLIAKKKAPRNLVSEFARSSANTAGPISRRPSHRATRVEQLKGDYDAQGSVLLRFGLLRGDGNTIPQNELSLFRRRAKSLHHEENRHARVILSPALYRTASLSSS